MNSEKLRRHWREVYAQKIDPLITSYKPCPYCKNRILRTWKYCERPECIIKHRHKLLKEKGKRDVDNSLDNLTDLATIESMKDRLKLRDLLAKNLAKLGLNSRDLEILEYRFGDLTNEKPSHTTQETGDKFGVTKQRVNQIEQDAIKKVINLKN